MVSLTKVQFATVLLVGASAVPTVLDERVACVGRACDAKQLLEREAGQDWLKREPGQDWTKREAGSEWSRRGEADLEKRIVLQCAYGKTCCCPNGGKQCMKCVVPGGCTFTCN